MRDLHIKHSCISHMYVVHAYKEQNIQQCLTTQKEDIFTANDDDDDDDDNNNNNNNNNNKPTQFITETEITFLNIERRIKSNTNHKNNNKSKVTVMVDVGMMASGLDSFPTKDDANQQTGVKHRVIQKSLTILLMQQSAHNLITCQFYYWFAHGQCFSGM